MQMNSNMAGKSCFFPNAEDKNDSKKSKKDDKSNNLLLQMGHFQADLCSPDSLFSPQFKKKKKKRNLLILYSVNTAVLS